jgi:hypothetical protein
MHSFILFLLVSYLLIQLSLPTCGSATGFVVLKTSKEFFKLNVQHIGLLDLKGIRSILFLKNGLKRIYRKKKYKNNLRIRSNNYEVCTAVAHCFPNSLGIAVLENINLSSDRNRATIIVK